jgi:hypothetical protein
VVVDPAPLVPQAYVPPSQRESATDVLGQRGEALVYLALTESDRSTVPLLFQAAFMGDKWPGVDYVVQLIGAPPDAVTPFFFVQAKATNQGHTTTGRLKVKVSKKGLTRLRALPAPTYIVGVDEGSGESFIVSSMGARNSFGSISRRFPINAQVRAVLWDEVYNYWRTRTAPAAPSQLTDDE